MRRCIWGPGEHAAIGIGRGLIESQKGVVWAGRGNRWVTQVIFSAKSSPVAAKVVSISSPYLPIDSHTPVAQVIEHQSFPTAGRFVRPGSRRYQEWQHLILENTNSARMRLRLQ
ncbi:hypothetical protein JG688_00002512 [Phytophthora aleatoria]|uniref:Uncharacterized protein n=1 Tax=Phytophthora aleatoria TaxID=2496075 RepID=A0A8J5J4F3_9STRA|nr:hypothetical protein JG688_00002512 [Phytophthora aleatoria]